MPAFDYGSAMDAPSSPLTSPNSIHASRNKCPRSPDKDADDHRGYNSDEVIDPALRNQGPSAGASTVAFSRNLAVFAKRYATKHKLNAQHVTEVDTFVMVRHTLKVMPPPSD
jgi:hypothetical protein